jgi:hypothetical protein
MAYAVYAIATTDTQAVRIGNRLRNAGFSPSDISVLAPDRGVRAGTGAILGGALGWLAGIGALAIPGVGPLIAAGPILAALSGAALGGTVGGATGGLVGLGIPEYEAQQYAGKLREGNVLMAVHVEDSDEAAKARKIFTEEKAESISTGSEAGS